MSAFGYGSLTTPAGTQASISQSSVIAFNSRGIPLDSTGNPTGNDAIYLNNGNGVYYAVTVSSSGRVSVWQLNGSGSTWIQFA
jgi:hypothetical protein